jgi:hypothetical protein
MMGDRERQQNLCRAPSLIARHSLSRLTAAIGFLAGVGRLALR